MKKLLLSLAAMIAMVATSCFQADVEDINLGEEGLVTFTINAPGISSRAINDGTGATQLTYAIYDAEWKYLSQTTIDEAFASNLTEVISLRLVKNKTYNFVFWAQHPDATCYTLSLGTTVGDEVAPTVTVKYDNVDDDTDAAHNANDETRDAFFGQLKGLTVDGTVNETVILTRPFAQINFATNHEDTRIAEAAGYKLVKDVVTSFTTRAYTELNLADGSVDGEQTVTFTATQNPSEQLELKDGTKYDWLAMNYILVPANESSLSTCSMTAQLTNQQDITIEYPMAPAKRNWRTNLVGNLLTEQAVIEVKIDPVPEDEFPKTEAQKLAAIAAVGGQYTLTEDMELTDPLIVLGDLTLNLNGKTISANYNKSVGAVIKNNATLTLIGGTVSSLGENGGSAIQNSGTMIVENATLNGAPNANGSWPSYAVNNTGNLTLNNVTITSYHGGVASYNDGAVATLNDCVLEMSGIAGFTSHGFYTYSNGAIVVNGGNYANRATDQSSTGGSVINGLVEVLAGDFSGRIDNYYGTPVLKGGTYTVKPNARFVAEGYMIVENAEKTQWFVAPAVEDLESAVLHEESGLLYNGNDANYQSVYYLTSASDLKKATKYFVNKTNEANKVSFELVADIDMAGTTWEPWTIMWINFDGNNHTISNLTTAEGWRGGLFGYIGAAKVENLVIKNATVNGAQAGILAGAVEGVTVNNVKVAGRNVVNYAPYATETWGGVGALTGVLVDATINAEVVEGATVTVNTNGIVTEAKFVDALTGYIQPNKGAVVANGTVNINIDTKIVADTTGTTYVGEVFENPMSDALVLENATLSGDASIEVKRTYKAIVIENVKGSLNGDFITIDNNDNSVMVLQNLDLTLADGKKLIKSLNKTIYQVFMANITINGVKVTTETIAPYMENVGWYQVVEEI